MRAIFFFERSIIIAFDVALLSFFRMCACVHQADPLRLLRQLTIFRRKVCDNNGLPVLYCCAHRNVENSLTAYTVTGWVAPRRR